MLMYKSQGVSAMLFWYFMAFMQRQFLHAKTVIIFLNIHCILGQIESKRFFETINA